MAPVRAQDGPPAGFVDAADAVEGLVVDLRYFGTNNFVGAPIDGYERPRCWLTRQAAAALARVQRDLAHRGLGLKVYDCYRPARAVAHFIRWAKVPEDGRTKAEHYPELDKSKLLAGGYIGMRSAHSRGSTVDLTLVRRADGRALDMGTPFDFFDPRSWPSDTTVNPTQRANRMLLREVMMRRGFRPLRTEWWHFTLANEPFPRTLFDFPVR
jgi:zinc D-Ala-D-Ala dipeptidase